MARQSQFQYAVAVLLIACIIASVVQAQTITLRDGQQIHADIIREDEHAVILDLGYDLLRVPRSQVEAIIADASAADEPSEAAAQSVEPTTTGARGLYHTAARAKTTIERNVVQFGEAVVMVATPAGTGSGFLINDDGYLITNYHVIARETHIKTTVFRRHDNGFEHQQYDKVRIIALNPYVDLALLKIEDPNETFPYVFLGDMDRVAVGETVFAIGNPLGLTRSVSQGIVSTANRDFEGRLYIQTTTDLNPGNSGGPLFNLAGEVIGVTSMGYLAYGGLNFAIPVDVVRDFIENWDAFAYRQDNPNAGFRYLQPGGRKNPGRPPEAKLPRMN